MNIKSFLLRLAASSLLIAPFAASAATPPPGTLIKASGPSVYYSGQDGKRYVFPNEKTYATWYSGFGSVNVVTDAELAALPLGGNVTYRPGVKLVKINTDPRTYAVAAGGTLRWIQTESVARDLYGADWNTKVDDIADTYFVNYKLGLPIANASEYSMTTELALATSIGRDKNIDQIIPPTPTPTPTSTPPTPVRTGTLTNYPETIALNQLVTLIATAQPSSGLSYINLYFDGFLMRHCEFSPCGTEARATTDKTAYVAVAEFFWLDNVRAYTTTTIMATVGAPGVTVTITQPEIKPQTLREIVVDVDSSFVAKTIDLFLDGNTVRGCNDVQQCRYTGTETSPVGTIHTTYAVVRDANGFIRQSPTKSFAVVDNPRPIVTITPGKNAMFVGETVDVTVSATDDDGIAFTEITNSDGTSIKRCETNLCTAQIVRPTAGTFYFLGRAGDIPGKIGTATSSAVVVE
jgi:hypothetical protein